MQKKQCWPTHVLKTHAYSANVMQMFKNTNKYTANAYNASVTCVILYTEKCQE